MKGRITMLDDVGDLDAPPGSPPWCRAAYLQMHSHLRSLSATSQEIEGWLDLFRRHDGWKQLTDKGGRPFASYEQFCHTPPPFGLGYSVERIGQIIGERRKREARELAADHKVKPLAEQGKRGKKRVDNVKSSQGGNDASYLVRRLKRDHPAIAEALARGEYPSARAAAIAAGVVRVPTLLDLFARLWAKASHEEREAIRKAVSS